MNTQSDYKGPERRSFPRLNVVVSYAIVGEEENKKTGFSRNISAGGICIVTDQNIPIDTNLVLEIFLPDNSPPIETKGIVVWSKSIECTSDKRFQFDLGVEYITIAEKDRQRIFDYVLSRLEIE